MAHIGSILIIRLSAIGDIVMASPLAAMMRARYPDARITWLVQSEARELLETNPALDEVIAWPRREWRQLWRTGDWLHLAREVAGFVKRLRACRFGMVIDLQGLLKSAVWARLTGAPERIGLDSREGGARLMTRVIVSPAGDKRIGAEYRHLAEALGLDSGAFRMQLVLAPEDEACATEFIRRRGLEAGYAVICPFTTRPQKHWVEGYWPVLAERLYREFRLRTVMLGGPGDREAAARITAASGSEVVDVTGKTRLRQAAALIRCATLLVGVDTGLSHMGTAFEIPTIALFGSTRPYLQTDSARTVILYKDLDCAPCKRNPTCGGAYTCMKLIGVDEVTAAAARLLAKG